MTADRADAATAQPPPTRVGRKRDSTRDLAILAAAADVLGEVGYPNFTVDLVVARARVGKSTVYRRWLSKEDLILDAVARLRRTQVDLENLPDTGNLRDDFIALFKPDSPEEERRRLKVLAGLTSLVSHTAFADAASSALVDPWAEAHYRLMRRAVERGEIPADADIATISQVLPTMAAYRALVQRKAFDREFLMSSIDVIIMPALTHPSRTD